MTDNSQGAEEPGGFLSRWSRRKSLDRRGETLSGAPAQTPPEVLPSAPHGLASPRGAVAAPAPASTETQAPVERQQPVDRPVLTLKDVEELTPQSDFSVFARPDVDPAVRNAAMKKLFHADPHFNVMDGLDVYIDDYNTPDPLPKAIMRTMLQARALGLLDDELKDQDKPEPDPAPVAAAQVDTSPPHENIDLQLQPDDAAGRGGFAQGPVAEPTVPGPADQHLAHRADDPRSPA